MQQIAGHDVRLDALDQRRQGLHGAATPADQSAFGDISPHAREDLVLAIEGKVIVELRDQNMGQQVWPCHAARDRTAGRGLLHHPLAAAAGFLNSGDLDHLHLSGDHIEKFTDILAHHTKIAATVRAAGTRIKLAAFAQGRIRDTRTTAQRGRRRFINGGLVVPFVNGRLIIFGHGDQQVFERQFQLLDLALNLFRGLAEGQFLEFRDAQAQGLNQLVMDPQCGRDLRVFGLQGRDHRL